MPFLGNTPANTFVSIAKQTITGNGGTSYSLSYAVTSANDIDVFYNNVRQEPGVAYTANATTITFTEAIQSTDSVYILFNGQAVGTIDAPAGAYLPTTGGTVNGQLSVNNKIQIQQDASSNNRLILRGTSGSSYRWNVDNFGSSNQFRIFRENDSDATLGMVAAQFDSAGRLILPQQPGFLSLPSGSISTTSGSAIPFNTTVYNDGNHFNTSTYTFTAPISGRYLFSGACMIQWQQSGRSRGVTITAQVNGTTVANLFGRNAIYVAGDAGSWYDGPNFSYVLKLNANDAIKWYIAWETDGGESSTQNVFYHGSYLSGTLLG